MNFDYNEEQRLLADAVRRFVAKDYAFDARKAIVASEVGASDAVWRTFAEMGLLGLSIPAEYGGFGGGAVDLLSVMDAFGQALVVEPYLATVGLGAQLIARAGSHAQKKALLPPIVEGRLKLAFAHGERSARYELAHVATTAIKTETGWRLEGQKCVVLGAPSANQLIVSARVSGAVNKPKGLSLFLVARDARGLDLEPYRTLDQMRAADVLLEGVEVGPGALLGRSGAALESIEDTIDFATTLVCAEAVGAMQFTNDATLEYLKTRKQFGVPIGAFQALQHRMVDMVIATEQARSMAFLACAKVDSEQNREERRRLVSAAKVRVADACRHISQEAIQLHGGMGMTDELKVSHSFRRLTVIAQQFGDADHHLERFAALEGS